MYCEDIDPPLAESRSCHELTAAQGEFCKTNTGGLGFAGRKESFGKCSLEPGRDIYPWASVPAEVGLVRSCLHKKQLGFPSLHCMQTKLKETGLKIWGVLSGPKNCIL